MKNTEKKTNYWRQIDPQEIISLHAESNYTTLLLKNGKSLMVSICLKELEKRLSKNDDTQYLRISRSVLVNVQFIMNANYNIGNSHIILTNNEEVAISRRKRLQIKSKMKQLSMGIRM